MKKTNKKIQNISLTFVENKPNQKLNLVGGHHPLDC